MRSRSQMLTNQTSFQITHIETEQENAKINTIKKSGSTKFISEQGNPDKRAKSIVNRPSETTAQNQKALSMKETQIAATIRDPIPKTINLGQSSTKNLLFTKINTPEPLHILLKKSTAVTKLSPPSKAEERQKKTKHLIEEES